MEMESKSGQIQVLPLEIRVQVLMLCRFSALPTEPSSQPRSTFPFCIPSPTTNTLICSKIFLKYLKLSNYVYLCIRAYALPVLAWVYACVYIRVRYALMYMQRTKLGSLGLATSHLSDPVVPFDQCIL